MVEEVKNPSEEIKNEDAKSRLMLHVPINDKYKHGKPFDAFLPSNIINAMILSFVGRKSVVYYLMQIICHKGRAYCFY